MKIKIFLIGVMMFIANYLNASNFKIPSKIDLFQYAISNAVTTGNAISTLYGFPDFRIWGWSRDGKVAYSIERLIDGRGGRVIDFVVFDMITDKIIFELKMDSFDYGDADFKSLYKLSKNKIINAMKKNKIVEKRTNFSAFPIKKNGKTYKCFRNMTINTENKEEDIMEFYGKKIKYDIIITLGEKSKIIKTEDVIVLDVYVCGYFLSPFENRALVVIAEEKFVFEGTELFYNFSGCNLNTGFK